MEPYRLGAGDFELSELGDDTRPPPLPRDDDRPSDDRIHDQYEQHE
jgi:hypothetical protein